MTRLALQNPIAISMICLGLVVFAAVVTPRMPVDTFPELTPPVLVVGTLAPGLGPKDVEKTITWRIEKYVSATPGVDFVQSTSRNNLSVVFVWLKWGTDLNSAQTLVQQQVAFAMAAVPKSLGVLPPFVLQYDPSNAPVIQVSVSGGGLTGPQLYDYAFNNIEPLLEGIPGVASAAVDGGRQRQINVLVDAARAQSRGVTSAEIAAAVAQSNALLPSGELLASTFDANVYTNAVAGRVGDIGDAAVKHQAGRAVLIKDVATIDDGGSPETQSVSVGGNDAVYLNVLRVPGGNTLAIVEAVKKAVKGLEGLPAGVEVKPIFDQSTFVRTSYTGLQREIFQALVLISLVILLFLQSGRSVLIAVIAVPIAFAVILIVLYVSGQTLNAFTLGGLMLAMGPLVDISVVVIESIHRHRHEGHSEVEAALKGANSVAAPALAATLTTVAVLFPVTLLAGLAKKLFGPLALTVGTAMFAGYFVSMLVTPLACRYFLTDHRPGRFAEAVRGQIGRVADGYARALRAVLHHRVGGCRGLCRDRGRQPLDGHSPAEHVLPRNRRVDGVRLRPLGARGPRSETPRKRSKRWARGSPGAAAGHGRSGAHERGVARQRAQRHDQPEQRAPHGFHPGGAARPRTPQTESARHRRQDARDPDEALSRRRALASARGAGRQRVLERLRGTARRGGSSGQPRGARRQVEGRGRGGPHRSRRSRHLPVAADGLPRAPGGDRPDRGRVSSTCRRAVPPRRRSTPRSATSMRRASGSMAPTASRTTW